MTDTHTPGTEIQTTFRKCTQAEREAFADIYRFYERYANVDAVKGNKEQDAFWLIVNADMVDLEKRSGLHRELGLAVMEYLDKRMTGKEKKL